MGVDSSSILGKQKEMFVLISIPLPFDFNVLLHHLDLIPSRMCVFITVGICWVFESRTMLLRTPIGSCCC